MKKNIESRSDTDGAAEGANDSQAERQIALRKIHRLMAFWRIEPHELRGPITRAAPAAPAEDLSNALLMFFLVMLGLNLIPLLVNFGKSAAVAKLSPAGF